MENSHHDFPKGGRLTLITSQCYTVWGPWSTTTNDARVAEPMPQGRAAAPRLAESPPTWEHHPPSARKPSCFCQRISSFSSCRLDLQRLSPMRFGHHKANLLFLALIFGQIWWSPTIGNTYNACFQLFSHVFPLVMGSFKTHITSMIRPPMMHLAISFVFCTCQEEPKHHEKQVGNGSSVISQS